MHLGHSCERRECCELFWYNQKMENQPNRILATPEESNFHGNAIENLLDTKIDSDPEDTEKNIISDETIEIPDLGISYRDRVKIFSLQVAEETGLKKEKIRDFSDLPASLSEVLKFRVDAGINNGNIAKIIEDMRKISDGIFPSLFTGVHTLGGDISGKHLANDSWVERGGHFQDLREPKKQIANGEVTKGYDGISNMISEIGLDGTVKKWHFNLFTAPFDLGYILNPEGTLSFCVDGRNEGLKNYYEDLISNYPEIVIDSLALKKQRFDIDRDKKWSAFSEEEINELNEILMEIQQFLLSLDDKNELANFLSPTDELGDALNQESNGIKSEREQLILRTLFNLEKDRIDAVGGFIDFRKIFIKLEPLLKKERAFFDQRIQKEENRDEGLYLGLKHITNMIDLWASVNGYITAGNTAFIPDRQTGEWKLKVNEKINYNTYQKIIPIFGHPKINHYLLKQAVLILD